MARPTTFSYGKGRLLIGDGATPEVFVAPCGFNQANVTIDKATNDTTVPDCDDPDAAVWSEKDVTTMSWTMQFQGVLAKESWPLYRKATFSSAPVNIHFEIKGGGADVATPDLRFAGQAHIKVQIQAQRGEKFQVTVDLEGTGELVPSDILIAA
ncbi:phage tail tube protein [Labrys sp. (in: a-proteobacteria)]|uniref:phage tail tube protein n=1 Tax=Labrys sp. (in: a-proteobacteria) TaxID=1917972 RepID=UPI0039E32E86